MWSVLENQIPNAVGLDFGTICTLIVFIGGLIFYANDFKTGITLHLIAHGALFMGLFAIDKYTSSSVNWGPTLVIFLIYIVIMSFSIYSMSKSAQKGQFI